jgi:hypothetical protein
MASQPLAMTNERKEKGGGTPADAYSRSASQKFTQLA